MDIILHQLDLVLCWIGSAFSNVDYIFREPKDVSFFLFANTKG